MHLFAILVAMGFNQRWPDNNPLHRDRWFEAFLQTLERFKVLKTRPNIAGFLAIFLPILIAFVVFEQLAKANILINFIATTFVLLYGLGRSSLSPSLRAYTQACSLDHWENAQEIAKDLGVDAQHISQKDWTQLHEKTLEQVSYRTFERLFAVLFWFLFFGPVGALLYRLSSMYADIRPTRELGRHWLWALEWVAVRILAVSIAVTGNFSGCMSRCLSLFLRLNTSTRFIYQAVLGALSVDESLKPDCAVTRKELSAIERLYLRTLWFWLACVALLMLI